MKKLFFKVAILLLFGGALSIFIPGIPSIYGFITGIVGLFTLLIMLLVSLFKS